MYPDITLNICLHYYVYYRWANIAILIIKRDSRLFSVLWVDVYIFTFMSDSM